MSQMPRSHFLCCVPVDAGALALGFFQAIAASVGILVTVTYFMMILYGYAANHFDSPGQLQRIYTIVPSLLLLLSGMCLIFSVLLIVGVKKRHPECVLVYFISGVLIDAGLALFWMKIMYEGHYHFFENPPFALFTSFFVYALCLSMVNSVYSNIRLNNNHKKVFYETLQDNFANDIKKDLACNSLQKDFKVDMPYNQLQKSSVNDTERGAS